MARNEEKHFGRLNRLYLLKGKEEYEKANPTRPRLDMLYTPEEIQKWLPSIKKDIDFYLKKSQVTCYSDAHVEDCQTKVVKLEKEFKAFVRKMKQLSPTPLEAIPWTNRPYKRKKSYDSGEITSKEFKRIVTPILGKQIHSSNNSPQILDVNWNTMDQPLSFSSVPENSESTVEEKEPLSSLSISTIGTSSSKNTIEKYDQHLSMETRTSHRNRLNHCINRHEKDKNNQSKRSIVNYDSSDTDSS